MQWIPVSSIPLLLCCGFVQAITAGTVYLERGSRGIVPCPLVKSRQIPPGDVVAMYWYYGSTSGTSLLISYFLGRVAPQNGIPEGVYDIDNEFNLIIENVTVSNEGTYYFQVKPRLKMMESGSVEVHDKVSPSRPYPTVIGCNQDHDADTCEARVQHDSTVHYLTCVMEQVKPAVQLRWLRLFFGGKTELNTSTTVRPVVMPAYTDSSLRNNTYSTSASVQVAAVDDEELYVCEAMGVAVGKGARMIVHFTKTYDEVQSSNNPGSSLMNNTFSTSASVQLTAVDDEEVYECEAMGVVGKGARMTVRFTKTHLTPSTATYDEGTTLGFTDEVSPTPSKAAEKRVPLIVLGVGFSISFVCNVAMFALFVHVCQKQKRNEYNPAPTMTTDTQV